MQEVAIFPNRRDPDRLVAVHIVCDFLFMIIGSSIADIKIERIKEHRQIIVLNIYLVNADLLNNSYCTLSVASFTVIHLNPIYLLSFETA